VSLVRQSVWAAAAAITLTAARFALVAIVARRLSQVGFGRFAYAQWLVDVAFLVCSLGVTGVASRYVAEYRTRPERLAALLVRWRPFAFGLPILASGAMLLGAQISDLRPGLAASATLLLWAAANGLWAMQTAVLSGLQRFDLIFRANVLAAAIMLTGALMLPLHRDDIALLFALMALACAAAATVGIAATRHLVSGVVGSIEPDGWRRIREYAFNIWITALLWSLVWSRGEMPIVRGYLGDAGVAQYAAAMTLFGGAIQGVMLAVSGVAPQLTMLWGGGRRDEAVATARAVMDVQLLFCAAGALLLICLGPELISLAFGSAYRQASGPLSILAVGLLATSVSSHNHVLQIATDARFSRDIMLFGLVLLFGAAVLLTPLYGLVGSAIARAGTMLVLAVVSLVVVARRWGWQSIPGRNVLIVTIVVGVSAFAAAWEHRGAVVVRVILLSIALTVLALSVRDRHGRLLSAVVPALFLGFFYTSTPKANKPAA
jgi:O-antigen/teichoic acid export membrane protein